MPKAWRIRKIRMENVVKWTISDERFWTGLILGAVVTFISCVLLAYIN